MRAGWKDSARELAFVGAVALGLLAVGGSMLGFGVWAVFRGLEDRFGANVAVLVFGGQTAQRAIWRYLVRRDERLPNDPLFAQGDGRQPLDRNGLRMMIERAGKRAGVPGACAHRFRHTFAVNYLRNGGNIAALQDMLGHSTLEMVRRYARLAEVDLAQMQKRASPADNWHL